MPDPLILGWLAAVVLVAATLALLVGYFWGSHYQDRYPASMQRAPNPQVFRVDWGSPVASPIKEIAPKPVRTTDWTHLPQRLRSLANSACIFRDYYSAQVPDSTKIHAMHIGLDRTVKALRQLVTEMTGNDPWAGHPPEVSP